MSAIFFCDPQIVTQRHFLFRCKRNKFVIDTTIAIYYTEVNLSCPALACYRSIHNGHKGRVKNIPLWIKTSHYGPRPTKEEG
jgi:hypothetical protein